MYYVISGGKKHATERLKWVKRLDNGVFVNCDEASGQGVLIDDEIFHVAGKPAIGKPTVDILWEDALPKINDSITEMQLALTEIYEALTEGGK